MSAQRSPLETTLMQAWMRRGVLAWLLAPLALVFFCVVTLRRQLYRRGLLKATRLPVPVVVVGNVFVGGTGKTPLTIWLVEALRALGCHPGVVSRGYGSRAGEERLVDVDAAAGDSGDEPLLIARRTGCPVAVGRDRAAAARALLASHPDTDLIVADDGLQHYALARDVEIVLSDERGAGNGWLLPAGPLREPASRPRDFTVVNGATGAAQSAMFPMQLQPGAAYRLSDPASCTSLETLSQTPVAAAAGIGNPARFFAMLRRAGLDVAREIPLPDHYDFAADPFADVTQSCILITEKDAVKCLQLESFRNDPRLWVVPVSAHIDAALAHRILEKCGGSPTA